MILFHLQTLGAGLTFPVFEILKNKILKNILNIFFLKRDQKRKNYEIHVPSRQFNSLQNEFCFSHLGQKLCEKVHF